MAQVTLRYRQSLQCASASQEVTDNWSENEIHSIHDQRIKCSHLLVLSVTCLGCCAHAVSYLLIQRLTWLPFKGSKLETGWSSCLTSQTRTQPSEPQLTISGGPNPFDCTKNTARGWRFGRKMFMTSMVHIINEQVGMACKHDLSDCKE